MKKLNLLDIDLGLFDGEGGAPAGGAEGGVATTTSKESQAPEKVVYGKVEGEGSEGESAKPQSKTDPNEAFESMIKGEYKDQFDKRVQDIINKRFKESKSLENKLGETEPIIKLLQRKYGAEAANELFQRIEAEYIEEMAYSEGMTPENYRKVYKAEETVQQQEEFKRQQDEQDRINQTIQRWTSEAESLKGEYPDFNLSEAMQSDTFADLLKSGVPVKAAYEILNLDNLKAQIQANAQVQVTQNIQAKQSRPKEAASKGQQGVVIKSDVSKLTTQDRAEIARRAARGEKISF